MGRGINRRSLFLAVATLLCVHQRLAAATPTEYEVKAAFIYNFAKYVQWPASPRPAGAPFIVGVLGKDPFGAILDHALEQQSVEGRPIVIRRFAQIEEIDCEILFVSSSERRNLPRIFEALSHRPVLTIGDMDQFATLGGMINLTNDENRIRFDMNPEAIQRAGLKAGSPLYRLARVVQESPR